MPRQGRRLPCREHIEAGIHFFSRLCLYDTERGQQCEQHSTKSFRAAERGGGTHHATAQMKLASTELCAGV